MAFTIDERDRDHLPVLTQVRLRLGDVALLPADSEVISDPADDLARVVAQVAPWAAEEQDPRRGHPAWSYRWSGERGGQSEGCGLADCLPLSPYRPSLS